MRFCYSKHADAREAVREVKTHSECALSQCAHRSTSASGEDIWCKGFLCGTTEACTEDWLTECALVVCLLPVFAAPQQTLDLARSSLPEFKENKTEGPTRQFTRIHHLIPCTIRTDYSPHQVSGIAAQGGSREKCDSFPLHLAADCARTCHEFDGRTPCR